MHWDQKAPIGHIKLLFEASKPNEKWFIDVTQINPTKKNLFLSAIIDFYNSEIISYTISSDRKPKFVYENIIDVLEKKS